MMKCVVKSLFLLLLAVFGASAVVSASDQDKIKEILSLADSVSTFSNIENFTQTFGKESHKEYISDIKADKYEWDKSKEIPNLSYYIVALADKSQNVTSWGISILVLDPETSRSDYDKTEKLFLLACRTMGEQVRQDSKVRVTGGTWGAESEAFYRLANGKIIRILLTRYDDGDASVLIDEKSEEYARSLSLRLKGSNISVREQPSTKAKVLGRINSNMLIDSFFTNTVKQNEGEKFPWYKINVDNPYTKFNGDGWVYGEFLTPVEYSIDEYEKEGLPWWNDSTVPME